MIIAVAGKTPHKSALMEPCYMTYLKRNKGISALVHSGVQVRIKLKRSSLFWNKMNFAHFLQFSWQDIITEKEQ